MSRHLQTKENDPIEIIYGSDGTIGKFYDVIDTRYAGTEHDVQGEGYLFEWNQAFGITLNLIDLTIEQMYNRDEVRAKCDAYLQKLKII